MENPEFCYRYVAQPSFYKRDKILFAFSPHIFHKITNSQKIPKIAIVTDGYLVFFLCVSPPTVAFHSENDLIIEIFEVLDRLFENSRKKWFLVETLFFTEHFFFLWNCVPLYWECGNENGFQIHTLVKAIQHF